MDTLRADYDAASGGRPAVGLIVLQSDEVLERELAARLPPGIERFHASIPNATDVTAETLRAMERELPAAAALLPAGVAYDVVAYGCTSASTVIGEARVAELVGTVVPNAAVTNPLTAVKARVRNRGASRIALLTPYSLDLSRAILEHLEGAGLEVVRAASFDERDDSRVARIAERSTLRAMVDLGAQMGEIDSKAEPEKFAQFQSEFQAETQIFKMFQEAISTMIKSIGEGMSSVARKS